MFKRKNINEVINISASVIFVTFIMVTLFFQRDFLFYRDFSIIWHGALLFAEGYSPFKDFIMPISPVSILLTGSFLSLTEKSWLAFQVFQIILNFILLISVTIFLYKYEKNKLTIFLSVLIFSFFYLIFLTHPWYNNLGAFFLIITIFLSNLDSKKSLFLCGMISGIAFFTKLDFGLMTLISSLIIILYRYFNGSKKKLILHIFIFLFAFFSFVIIFLSNYELEILKQTLSLSSEVATNRFGRFAGIFSLKNLLLIILGLLCIFLFSRESSQYLSYGLILISSAITSSLGGIEHTHYYFMFILPLLFNAFLQNDILKKYLFIIGPAILFLVFPAAKLNFHIFENIYYDSYESEYFNKRNISSEIQISKLNKCSTHLKNVYGPSDFCEIKRLLQKKIDVHKNKIKILNVSEINFLGIQLGQDPIKLHPIWYKDSQTVNIDLKNKILNELINNLYDVVIVQTVNEKFSSHQSRISMINIMNANKEYSKVSKVYESPSCMSRSQVLENCGINIYLKKSSYVF